ncbi:hypothetical protein UFOVP117_93 [uncultured Caudovirales phage]|uniref:Uncharacterized protein n=1 Tax=uncultured Caudovirales phage TaxID=2100421 RepID=A0A6J5L6N9_9CAUD|nr:hypothetical protein UFOVP117_93 [uncultured Caudovirales phage]
MNQNQKLFSKILNESLNEKAEEIAKKIKEKVETTEDVDKYDLEVGTDYGFDDEDEDYTFMRRGKNSSHGPFHFKRNKRGGDVAFGEKQIANMKKRIKEDDADLDIALQTGEKSEGNAFTKKLKDTPKGGKFKLGNKTYTDNSELDEDLGGMSDNMGPGDEWDINLSDDENPRVQSLKKKYMRNYPEEIDQEVDFVSGDEEPVNYRIKMGDGDFLDLAESELIDMIEELVTEEKVKDNLKKTGKSKGMTEYDRISKIETSENGKANKASFKKMADYVKAGSKDTFKSNPVMFPKGNGELAKMDKKAYTPSEYVDEYVDAFAYPGQTNIVFGEIKPDDKKIEMYLKGNKLTGNAELDEDGNPLGNVVPSKLGEKMYKNYKDNLYGAEQLKASYKRQTQPVDIAGEVTQKGGLKGKGKTSSIDKANNLLTKLGESTENESSKLLNEEMETMKKLIGYGYKQ